MDGAASKWSAKKSSPVLIGPRKKYVYTRHPRVSSNQAGRPKDTGGATKASAEYHLPDYTEPEPSTARAPEGEGEAT